MFLPLHINLFEDNIMFYRPNVQFFKIAVVYLSLQVLILTKQKTSPRFFLPKCASDFLDKLFDNEFYQDERMFELEAEKSTSSGNEGPLLGQRSRELIDDYEHLNKN